jgi:lipopolysaccharide export system permease protein
MLSVRQLNVFIDSLERTRNSFDKRVRNDLSPYLGFSKYLDSGWADVKAPPVKPGTKFKDLLPDSARTDVMSGSESYANSIKSTMDIASADYENKRKELRLYLIEWHSKYSMSIAVLVLFLIGAPLGSIVRKGGVGAPVVFAVIFFVVFFLLNNFGRKFVKQDVMLPIVGIWLATMVLLPIGFFLIYKAMHDSQILNKEFYSRLFRKIRGLFRKPSITKPTVELSNINK